MRGSRRSVGTRIAQLDDFRVAKATRIALRSIRATKLRQAADDIEQSSPLLSFLAESCRMISDLRAEDAVRIASLIIVAFCAAAPVVLGVAEKAQSLPVCRADLTATFGPQLDTFVSGPKAPSRAAQLCRSPVRSRGGLPTCSAEPYITCRGTCSNGAEWFSWQCCIPKDGFPPACSLDCKKQFAGCLAQ
jgi:hypothetical protein